MTAPTPGSAAIPGGLPLRPLTAWALLGVAGVSILFGFLGWIVPAQRGDALQRFQPEHFTSVLVLAAPLLAVLVMTKIGPALRQSNLIALIAMIEYAAAFLLGGLAFLVSFAGRFDALPGGVYAVGGMLHHFGYAAGMLLRLALLALALLWVYRIFTQRGGRLPKFDVTGD